MVTFSQRLSECNVQYNEYLHNLKQVINKQKWIGSIYRIIAFSVLVIHILEKMTTLFVCDMALAAYKQQLFISITHVGTYFFLDFWLSYSVSIFFLIHKQFYSNDGKSQRAENEYYSYIHVTYIFKEVFRFFMHFYLYT